MLSKILPVVPVNVGIPRRRPRECGDPGLTFPQYSMAVDHSTLDPRIREDDRK